MRINHWTWEFGGHCWPWQRWWQEWCACTLLPQQSSQKWGRRRQLSRGWVGLWKRIVLERQAQQRLSPFTMHLLLSKTFHIYHKEEHSHDSSSTWQEWPQADPKEAVESCQLFNFKKYCKMNSEKCPEDNAQSTHFLFPAR